jgi:hypothetical protein
MQDSSTGVCGNVAVEEFEGSNDVEFQRAILLSLVGSQHQTGGRDLPRTATLDVSGKNSSNGPRDGAGGKGKGGGEEHQR